MGASMDILYGLDLIQSQGSLSLSVYVSGVRVSYRYHPLRSMYFNLLEINPNEGTGNYDYPRNS